MAGSVLAAGCRDLVEPESEVLTTAGLIILPLQGDAETVSPSSFYVVNSREIVHRLSHADQFFTPYVELRFPVGSMTAVDGAPVAADDSVLVTVEPRAGAYGITLSPTRVAFSPTNRPRITFSYGVFADLSVVDGVATYSGRGDYAAALDVWVETSANRWQIVPASVASTGTDSVEGTLERGGTVVVAAPR